MGNNEYKSAMNKIEASDKWKTQTLTMMKTAALKQAAEKRLQENAMQYEQNEQLKSRAAVQEESENINQSEKSVDFMNAYSQNNKTEHVGTRGKNGAHYAKRSKKSNVRIFAMLGGCAAAVVLGFSFVLGTMGSDGIQTENAEQMETSLQDNAPMAVADEPAVMNSPTTTAEETLTKEDAAIGQSISGMVQSVEDDKIVLLLSDGAQGEYIIDENTILPSEQDLKGLEVTVVIAVDMQTPTAFEIIVN